MNIPHDVLHIARTLKDHGFHGYIVGGAVRDLIMNRSPKDWDVATNATPDQVESIFTKTVPTGKKHGTITVFVDGDGYEITTFRQDGDYTDGRRPDSVTFANDVTVDLARRDFTINAMAYDPLTDSLVDPFSGVDHCKNRILRFVGNGRDRIVEDPLRILRGVRFAAEYNLCIDPDNYDLYSFYSFLINRISAERIRAELSKMLMGENPLKALRLLDSFGLLRLISPMHGLADGMAQCDPHMYDVLGHTLMTVRYLRDMTDDLPLLLAGLFHDIGKPLAQTIDNDGRIRFYGHDISGASIARDDLSRLRFPNVIIDTTCLLIRHHMFDLDMGPKGVRRLLKALGADLFAKLLLLKKADILATGHNPDQDLAKLDKIKNLASSTQDSDLQLAINGYDLMDIGVTPGPMMGQALAYLGDLVLDDPTKNRKDDLIQLAKVFAKNIK